MVDAVNNGPISSVGGAPEIPTSSDVKSTIHKVKETASTLAGEAADAARKAANQGKDKAGDALTGLSQVVDDAATLVGDKVGNTYGEYGHRAANGVADFAKALQDKDIDELLADTRTFVKKNPVVAIGAAAAIGFVLTRLIRLGSGSSKDA